MTELENIIQEFDDKKEFSVFHIVNAVNEVNLTIRKALEGYEVRDVDDVARTILKTALVALES